MTLALVQPHSRILIPIIANEFETIFQSDIHFEAERLTLEWLAAHPK
jgi:hypothetical protein